MGEYLGRIRNWSIPRIRVPYPGALIPLISILLAFFLGAFLIYFTGVSPVLAYQALFYGAFGSTNNIAETLVRTTPLLLAGLGLAIAFRARVINIGAEGQIYMGALGIAYIGLFFGDLPLTAGLPLGLGMGIIAGAIWGGVAGLLKIKFQANEIIVTLMMNYIAIHLTHLLISGPWRDPRATEPFTARIAQGTILPTLISGTRLHVGVIIAVALALVFAWVIRNTVLGYQLQVVGANEKVAQYGGIGVRKIAFIAIVISGGMAGLAGAIEVSGLYYRVVENLSPGYGYTAIAIALLGRQNPIGVLFASFLFAALITGADTMQRVTGVPVAVVIIIQGLVLFFFLASEFLLRKIEAARIG